MWVQSESQQRFRKLEAAIRQIEPGDRRGELAGSFGAFHQWLGAAHPEIFKQAQEIASDIRLWRDTQDVLRQVWEHIYPR